jgi:DNA helicase-2/ATP-dependent DNA helicase PcrA
LALYRGAASAFEHHRPDRFVLRLIERIGVRRQQVFATRGETVERLRTIARLPELASDYVRREPGATGRDFTRYLRAVADSGLREDGDAASPRAVPSVAIVGMEGARELEVEHAFAIGLSADRVPGRESAIEEIPDELLVERMPPAAGHEAAMRRLLHVALTRAGEGLVLAWAERGGEDGVARAEPSLLYEEARASAGVEEEGVAEELFGPAEGLHAAFAAMRDELLEVVAHAGGRLGELRLDTGSDVTHAVSRYLELVKVAALIDRSEAGQPLGEAIGEVNALLAQGASAAQREVLEASGLDEWLRDVARDPGRRPAAGTTNGSEPSLDPFIPRRRGAPDALMLSASDIETYRICPLKYKFARVFRIPQEATIHQRFGIALHQVLERFHQYTGGTREELMELFESSWRRGGFGDSDDELQFRERALDALDRYWEQSLQTEAKPEWFERSFSFTLGGHLIRGRVDRIDRHPDGSYELIDYKTGKARTERQLREDVQLSLYQMGARESWGIETSAQSYLYVMSGDKVPVAHTEAELERVRGTVAEIGEGILRHEFQPTPSEEICSFCDYRIICPAAER